MMKIKGKKLEMSQIFDKEGKVFPCTLIKVEKDAPLEKLEPGASIAVTGISKGKGFTGVMKRWGFKGGPATHGQSDRARAPGSSGQTTSPGRVWPGKKMAGRHGGKKVTVRGLKILKIDKDKKVIKVLGAVPGARNSEVIVKLLNG